MRKVMLSLLLGLSSMASSAYEIDTEACAGTEYIYDLSSELVEYDPTVHTFVSETTPVFYAAYESIPFIYAASDQYSGVFIENTSSSSIRFFFRPTYYNTAGNEVNVSIHAFGLSFSSLDPTSATGATMLPNSMGSISFARRNTAYFGSAEIYWDSSVCFLEGPLKATHRTVFSNNNSGRGGVSINYINGGKSW